MQKETVHSLSVPLNFKYLSSKPMESKIFPHWSCVSYQILSAMFLKLCQNESSLWPFECTYLRPSCLQDQ
jgi:hypothetical protein